MLSTKNYEQENKMKKYLAIGTNIGNRQENINTAINQLNNNNVNIKKVSIYSQHQCMTEQDRFKYGSLC